MSYPFGRNVLLSSVGFDRLIDAIEEMNTGETLSKAQSYPPYNIMKKNERDYAIEIAVAGFKNDEIDIISLLQKTGLVPSRSEGRRAVEQGGSSLKDFVNAEGRTGYFQLEAAVYGRAGEPCRVCATPIRSMLQGQRTTFYCPTCQKS